MNQTDILNKIHEDLELVKQDLAEIKQVIKLDPKIKSSVVLKVQEARKRITKGQFTSNKDILREFEL